MDILKLNNLKLDSDPKYSELKEQESDGSNKPKYQSDQDIKLICDRTPKDHNRVDAGTGIQTFDPVMKYTSDSEDHK